MHESFHPNVDGEAEYANLVESVLGQTPDIDRSEHNDKPVRNDKSKGSKTKRTKMTSQPMEKMKTVRKMTGRKTTGRRPTGKTTGLSSASPSMPSVSGRAFIFAQTR